MPILRFALALCAASSLWAQEATALDRYVQAPDPSFRYELAATVPMPGVTTYVLDLVSQDWLTPSEVDRTEWRHWLLITKPDRPATQTALLFINGGSNGGRAPAPDPLMALLALESGAVIADLRMVPNQPLTFADGRPRSEDALIAFTWDQFLKTGDERWPARLPMTKAAVRAMDAVQAFLAGPAAGGVKVSRFVVAGGSKRGWTTWTAAAVDPRVAAIMPLVIDTLNVEPSFLHHWRAYGFWAPAVQDYADVNLMQWLGTERFRALMRIEDPYEYRDRLSLPKYIVNSAGDQFFLPDSSQFYFDDLPGEKYLRYVPNTDHGLDSLSVPFSLLAYFQAILGGTPRPRFSWKADRAAGEIRLRTIDAPAAVKLWQASNSQARDFRLVSIGPTWTSMTLTGEDGVYIAPVPRPAEGWTAFFLELTYPSGGKYPWVFTTEVVVTPDTYPFEAPR
ncbi:MAG: PhoPQ-activated pathogenicity-related family protein [Acidobacteria bacterium]|nr:PhoPQ-activated pathogenicity-related family protein [Acidobacteriota bacterium]